MSSKIPLSSWITLFVLGSADLISTASETMVIPAIPDIIFDFGITYSTSAWILSSYLISGAVMTPIAAKLSKIYGKKKILFVLLGLYIIGTLSAGFSTSMLSLTASRIIQGLGLAIFPVAFSIIQNVFPKEKLAIGQGVIIALFSSGSVIGLIAGGYIIDNLGWRTIFFVLTPFPILMMIFIHKRIKVEKEDTYKSFLIELDELPDNKFKTQRMWKSFQFIDVKGTVVLALLITSFLIVLTYLEDTMYQKSDMIILSFFSMLCISSFILFITFEKKTKFPTIPTSIFKDKILLPVNISLMITGLTTLMIYHMIPILVRSPVPLGFGGDAIKVVEVQLPFMIILFIVSTLSGFIVSRLGNIKPTIVGSIIGVLGFFGILFFHGTEDSIKIGLVIVGSGISLVQVGGFNIITSKTPRRFSEISVGVTSLLFIIGMAIGPAVSGLILQNFTGVIDGIGVFPSLQAYSMIFLIAAFISIVPMALILIVNKNLNYG
jgi:MFS family permease